MKRLFLLFLLTVLILAGCTQKQPAATGSDASASQVTEMKGADSDSVDTDEMRENAVRPTATLVMEVNGTSRLCQFREGRYSSVGAAEK